MKEKKILVFKIGALGDILMTTPFLRELRNQNKSSQIDFLVGDNCKAILENNEFIDNIIPFNQDIFIKKKIIDFYKLIIKIKKENYNEIYVLDKHWIFHLFAKLTQINSRIGLIRNNFSAKFLTRAVKREGVKHEVNFYLGLLEKIPKNSNKKLYFNILEEERLETRDYIKKNKLKNFIIFANLGGLNGVEESEVRKIPDIKFKELIVFLSKKKLILLVGGPDDRKYYDKFLLNKNIVNIAGDLRIPQTIELMKHAKHIYTTDCGPMHFAACTNTPITCFFGPTNPQRKAPLVKNIKSIWSDQDIYEEQYEIDGTLPDKNKVFFKKLNLRSL